MMNVKHYSSTEQRRFEEKVVIPGGNTPGLRLSGERRQSFGGFGGCFNELGWKALST